MSRAARLVLAAASLITLAACSSVTDPTPKSLMKSATKPSADGTFTCSGYMVTNADGSQTCVPYP